MACCGKASRQSSPSNPVMIGAPNGVTVRARVMLNAHGMDAYQVGWFTGDLVEMAVLGGVLELDD